MTGRDGSLDRGAADQQGRTGKPSRSAMFRCPWARARSSAVTGARRLRQVHAAALYVRDSSPGPGGGVVPGSESDDGERTGSVTAAPDGVRLCCSSSAQVGGGPDRDGETWALPLQLGRRPATGMRARDRPGGWLEQLNIGELSDKRPGRDVGWAASNGSRSPRRRW